MLQGSERFSVRPVARTRPRMLSLEPQRLMSLEFDYSMMPFHCPERSRKSSHTTHLQALKGTGNEAYMNFPNPANRSRDSMLLPGLPHLKPGWQLLSTLALQREVQHNDSSCCGMLKLVESLQHHCKAMSESRCSSCCAQQPLLEL